VRIVFGGNQLVLYCMIYVSDGVDITTDQVQTEHVTRMIFGHYTDNHVYFSNHFLYAMSIIQRDPIILILYLLIVRASQIVL